MVELFNAQSAQLHEFNTLGMQYMTLELPWLVLNDPWRTQAKEGYIVGGIHQPVPVASPQQPCQDSWLRTAQVQLCYSMPCKYISHHLGDIESAHTESYCRWKLYGRYLFKYYRLWDTASRAANCPKHWSMSAVRCINGWNNHWSGYNLHICIPSRMLLFCFTVHLASFIVCKAFSFKVEFYQHS